MFLPVCGLFFHFFLTVTLDEWEFLTLMKPNLSVVFLSEGVLFVCLLGFFDFFFCSGVADLLVF